MEAIADQRRVTVVVLTADRRRLTADLTAVPRRLTAALMRARCRPMVEEATRVRLLHPTGVVWVAGRRLTAAAGLMGDSEVAMHLLTAELDRQADSAVVGTHQAVEGIAAEAAEGTAAVAVTKTLTCRINVRRPIGRNGNGLSDACILQQVRVRPSSPERLPL